MKKSATNESDTRTYNITEHLLYEKISICNKYNIYLATSPWAVNFHSTTAPFLSKITKT